MLKIYQSTVNERQKMKLILLRPYGHKSQGATLSSVPYNRAKKLIERKIAMLVEEPKRKPKNAKQNKT